METSLTDHQRMLLDLFSHHPEWTLKDFARQLRVSPAAMTKAVARLERAGLIARKQGERDRRCIFLRLTQAGEYLVSVGEERVDASNAEAVPETRKHLATRPEKTAARISRFANLSDMSISAEWYAWCQRWLDASQFTADEVPANYYGNLLAIGAWLGHRHPEVTSPEHWTVELVEDFGDAIEHMPVDYWLRVSYRKIVAQFPGKPMSDPSKSRILSSARRFFKDCQQWGWIAMHFDPEVDLRHRPYTFRIDDAVWDKLQWAARTLDVHDLFYLRTLHSFAYPLEMMRALAVILCFAGLRPNELCQLRVGAAWETWPIQRNSLNGKPAPGNFFRQARYHLEVPLTQVNPVNGAISYTREVDPLVVQSILQWEAVRPSQPAVYDTQAGEMVELLFSYRGRCANEGYIKRAVIPLLFYKTGIPQQDSHGIITTHRIRATVFRSRSDTN